MKGLLKMCSGNRLTHSPRERKKLAKWQFKQVQLPERFRSVFAGGQKPAKEKKKCTLKGFKLSRLSMKIAGNTAQR